MLALLLACSPAPGVDDTAPASVDTAAVALDEALSACGAFGPARWSGQHIAYEWSADGALVAQCVWDVDGAARTDACPTCAAAFDLSFSLTDDLYEEVCHAHLDTILARTRQTTIGLAKDEVDGAWWVGWVFDHGGVSLDYAVTQAAPTDAGCTLAYEDEAAEGDYDSAAGSAELR